MPRDMMAASLHLSRPGASASWRLIDEIRIEMTTRPAASASAALILRPVPSCN